MKGYFKELFYTEEFYIGILIGLLIMIIAMAISSFVVWLIK